MTTICYSHEHKTIAYDSRATDSYKVVTDKYDKCIECNGVKFFISGSPSDVELFIAMYNNPEVGGLPEVRAIVLDSGLVYDACVSEDGVMHILQVYYDIACGSGGDWAIAALEHGATPREALKYAIAKDPCSGGKIHLAKVGK